MTNLFLPLYFQSPDESGITLLQSFEHYCLSPLPYTVAEINILWWYGKYLKILSLNGDQQIYEIIFYFCKTDNCSLWWDATAHQCIRKKKHLAVSLICVCLTSFFFLPELWWFLSCVERERPRCVISDHTVRSKSLLLFSINFSQNSDALGY